MHRLALLACLVAAVLAAPAGAAKERSWAEKEIELVTARGLLGGDAKQFRPADPLTESELADLIGGLTGREPAMPANPAGLVRLDRLDARLVRALGLAETARRFADALRAAGLRPTARFGTEVVARRLGLRFNHPEGDDQLELAPSQPATRAEAAYSAARILAFEGWEVERVRAEAEGFALPALGDPQRAVLQTALSLVGMPYVWGGTSELPQKPFGAEVPGGFDCSGLVWRVYKLQAYGELAGLEATIAGRTTYAMSGEVKKAKRIPLAELQPADLVFFGARAKKSKPAEIDHMGIYLGGGWFVHASHFGVAISPLASDWYAKRFAWGRRPLAELPNG